MASITIRRLSDETKERLRKRAERSGCSLKRSPDRSSTRQHMNRSSPLPRIRTI